MKSYNLIKVTGLCVLGILLSTVLNAAPVYSVKTTSLLDKKGNVIGTITPATQLETIDSSAKLTKVRLKGWSAFGAESVVFQQMGKRIILAFLEESTIPNIKKGKVKKDVYESEWNESSIVGWVNTADIISSQKVIWEKAHTLFSERCGGCHQPHPAHEFTANQWPNIVKAMKDRAGLTSDDQWLLTKYMQNHAKDIK